MSEKLSQGQIDALLKRISSGDADVETEDSNKARTREYDFRSPKKFTKEQLKALDSLHENLSRVLSSYLSGMLRMFCEVSVLQIEEQRYYEYSNALPDTALIGLIDLKPSEKRYSEVTMMVDMSTTVGFLMIDRLLGGAGNGYNITRDYTDIELSILENVFQKIVVHIEEIWCNYISVKCDLTSVETNSRLLQVFAPEDTVVIVALQIKFKNLQGNLSICIPAASLEETIGKLGMKYSRIAKKEDDKEAVRRTVIMERVYNSDLEVKAVLDEFQLELQDVLSLQVSDVIPLSKNINGDITITVDNTPWFNAKLGEVKLKKAVKLNSIMSK